MTEGLKSEALFFEIYFFEKIPPACLTATHLPLQGRLFSAKRRTKSSSLSKQIHIYKKKKHKEKNPCAFPGAEGETRRVFNPSCSLCEQFILCPFLLRKKMDEEFESPCPFCIIQKKGTGENPDTFLGAEGETRTLAPVTRPTPLAGAPRHQLEYFCMVTYIIKFCCCRWRREWDSNPRYVAVRRFSRPFRYNHFGISPY